MFIYVILVLLPALVFTQDAKLEDTLFNALDTNKDGKVTKLETETYFLSFDTGKDGTISKGEFRSAVDKLDPSFAGHEDALFGLLDRDKNGKADKGDIDTVFTLADADNSNDVTKDEFHTIFNKVIISVG